MVKIANVEVNEVFEGYVLLKAVAVRQAKNGHPYLSLVFQDTSGEMEGKLWDATAEEIDNYQPGIVVHLKAKRELYQGRSQLKIIKMRLLAEDETVSPADFIESAPQDKEEIANELMGYLQSLVSPYKEIVTGIYEEHQERFLTYPAAKKHHHAYYGGLSYHTLTMLHLAEALCNEYENVNRSLLYAGIFLHDFGKIFELTGPNTTEYTLEGNLVGHLVLIDEVIVSYCQKEGIDLNSEEVTLLRHMVLSHHGLLEYGSPVRPRILEAELLHLVDHLDATMQMMTKAIERTSPGNYTERIFGLDNRSFYRPKE